MNASLKRRISIASSWASARIAVLDAKERYEDSYAITQEFCEWITGMDQHGEHLETWSLNVPSSLDELLIANEAKEEDEMLEI